jgi:AraC-like DNA-binding protein
LSHALAICHGGFGRAVLFHLDRPMTRHLHREGHLLFHVEGPAGELEVGDGCAPLSPDFGVAVNSWEPHGYEPGCREGTVMLVLYVRPSWFADLGAGGEAPLRFGRSTVEILPRLGRRVREVAALLGEGGAPATIAALVFDLMAECLAQSGVPGAKACDVAGGIARGDVPVRDGRLRRAIRLMTETLGSELELDVVATGAGLSRAHFFKLFRDEAGVPPGLFRNAIRMERALSDIAGTPKPITDIGFDLGFSSTSSFSRFFVLNTGLSPTEYRRAARASGAPGRLGSDFLQSGSEAALLVSRGSAIVQRARGAAEGRGVG